MAVTLPDSQPVPPDLRRRQQLADLAAMHDQWVSASLPGAAFDPGGRRPDTDYPEHYVDVDGATPEQEDAFQEAARHIMGLPAISRSLHKPLGHDTSPGNDELHHYWTMDPEGLAKWVKSRHPWTALLRNLRKHISNIDEAKATASAWYHDVFHTWPGQGHKRRRRSRHAARGGDWNPDLHPRHPENGQFAHGPGGSFLSKILKVAGGALHIGRHDDGSVSLGFISDDGRGGRVPVEATLHGIAADDLADALHSDLPDGHEFEIDNGNDPIHLSRDGDRYQLDLGQDTIALDAADRRELADRIEEAQLPYAAIESDYGDIHIKQDTAGDVNLKFFDPQGHPVEMDVGSEDATNLADAMAQLVDETPPEGSDGIINDTTVVTSTGEWYVGLNGNGLIEIRPEDDEDPFEWQIDPAAVDDVIDQLEHVAGRSAYLRRARTGGRRRSARRARLLVARPAPRPVTRAAAVSSGAMVALVPSATDAQRLAVSGGEPVDQLHLTLTYLGDAAAWPSDARAAVIDAIDNLAAGIPPVSGAGFAVSLFNPTGTEPCIVLGVSGEALDWVHSAVAETVQDVAQEIGVQLPDQRSPWIPHITLLYNGDVNRIKELVGRTGPIIFDQLRVAFAGQHTDAALDESTAALLAAMDQYEADAGPARANWDADKHPRIRKGLPGGGRFLSLAEHLHGKLKAHESSGGRGDPFEGFSREQLRRAAKSRGLPLRHGASRDEIAQRLIEHLHAAKDDQRLAGAATSGRKSALVRHVQSGVDQTRPLGGGMSARTDLVTFKDGSRAVRKTVRPNGVREPKPSQDSEELASVYGRALGLNVPEVYRSGKSTVYMQYVDRAETGDERFGLYMTGPGLEEVAASDDGRRLGLFDLAIGNLDRNGGNWLVTNDNQLVGIDHGLAFPDDEYDNFDDLLANVSAPNNPFTHRVIDVRPDGTVGGALDFSTGDVQAMRRALQSQQGEFDRLGRTGWYQGVMRRLDFLEQHATGDGTLFS